MAAAKPSSGDEAEWIWATNTSAEQSIPVGQRCFFRKPINLRVPALAKIEIAADDEYQLFINGHAVGVGKSSRQVDEYDVGEYFEVGRNIVAIEVTNRRGDTAALAARVSVRPENSDKWYTFSTNPSWKTTTEPSELWETVVFNDRLWGSASSFGPLGDTVPWDRTGPPETPAPEAMADAPPTDHPQDGKSIVANDAPSPSPQNASADTSGQRERFQIQKGFGVQRVLGDDKVGSVIAMTFNEFGHLLISQENGPLLLAYDDNGDGIPETVRTYCELVKSCQGILALNGDVFVTADGPEGAALYKLVDADRNGTLEKATAIVKFVDWKNRPAQPGEHGAHGLRLGPDGMIYVALGSHVQAVGEVGDGQTYRDPYEGDLLPRYEDPGGHGRGVKAPGGTIVRTNPEGSVVERVAGGLRNPYDIVFHSGGAMFVHDADMESDVDTAWYRPNAIFDVTEAGEFGWRSGWAKWPSYYLDRLPDMLDTGRGSPTGGVCYEHFAFPIRYQNTLFMADWSEGRILNVRIKPSAASFDADSEVFLQGQPLNVTDLEVGPEGALYFCTGGRDTAGGIYRVIYKGEIPERMTKLGTGIAEAVRQPQIESAWTRQKIASIKADLGDQWNRLVAGVAYSDDNPPDYRVRAMTLMQLFGPVPSEELLLELSEAESELVRAKAASMLGRNPGPEGKRRLIALLEDNDPAVQRAACEAMLRGNLTPDDTAALLEILKSSDRTLAFVGCKLLQRMPVATYRDQVVDAEDTRVAIVGMLALVSADPTEANALAVLARASEMMSGFLSDADFIDLLRLCQVALHRSGVDAEKVAALGDQIAEEFPAGEPRINHEVIRLATYLRAESLADRALRYLESDAPLESRTLVAMCLQSMSEGWTAKQRFVILKFFEKTANRSTSGALPMYMTNVTRDFASVLSKDDLHAILEQGHVWQNAALAAIYKIDRPIDKKTTGTLMELDRRLQEQTEVRDVQRRLRTGIIALLASSEEAEASDYLRQLWRDEPQRRSVISMALSVHPEGDNWDYLVRSLNIVDADAAEEVVRALRKVPVATDDPMALRHLILLGVRAEKDKRAFEDVQRLLEHWTGVEHSAADQQSMRPWQKWYSKVYPDRPAAVLPKADQSRWDFEQLVGYLESDKGRTGDPERGKMAYTKASCAQCHRFGNYGESIGPDLSGLARRFTKREIVESILYPAHVVSDQYASKKVLTLDGKVLVGMVSEQSDGSLIVRDSRNDTSIVGAEDVDQILPNTSSIMPSGLIDELSLQEISDMMAYLGVVPAAEIAQRP
ncbi:c-type cytochrome [Roseiconus nitratireducens]|uniref:C-type cytochrome n=2 Tax=Roseiconus nitratireducens TaxID=2605748 RepID=A0A5M6DFJ8_9BACT|nr:c-type cytochrome [Roseiconus nitratireducens]